MNRRRIAIGVSSVSGLAVVAAGAMNMIGSSTSAKAVDLRAAPVAAVSAAAAATAQAGTAQTDTVVTVASPAIPARGRTPAAAAQTLTMHGSGLFDFGRQIGSISLTVPTGNVDEVLTPETVYLRRSATPATSTAKAEPASAWTSMGTAQASDGDLISGGATEPSLVFAMLDGVQPGVQEVGQDTVRGVPVVHYQGTLDLKSAAAAAPAAQKQSLAKAARAFTTTKIPFDAYLDAQGRLRRFVATFSFVDSAPSKPVVRITSATELYGFGTAVTVAAPAVPAAPAAPTAPTAPASTPGHGSTTPSTHPTSPTSSHK